MAGPKAVRAERVSWGSCGKLRGRWKMREDQGWNVLCLFGFRWQPFIFIIKNIESLSVLRLLPDGYKAIYFIKVTKKVFKYFMLWRELSKSIGAVVLYFLPHRHSYALKCVKPKMQVYTTNFVWSLVNSDLRISIMWMREMKKSSKHNLSVQKFLNMKQSFILSV